MKRAKILAAAIYAMLVMGTVVFVHFPELKADEAQAQIAADEARATALRVVPGDVKDSELENERGRLIYSFEIVRPGQPGITEVHVSAINGSVVHVHRENARKDHSGEYSGKDQKFADCQNGSFNSAAEDLL